MHRRKDHPIIADHFLFIIILILISASFGYFHYYINGEGFLICHKIKNYIKINFLKVTAKIHLNPPIEKFFRFYSTAIG
jgi:hypothetical protein